MLSEPVYATLVAGSTAIAVAMIVWLWERREELTVTLFLAIAGVEAIGGWLVVAELLAPDRGLATVVFGAHAATLGAVSPLFFLFTLAYIGRRRWLSRTAVAVILGGYALLALLQVTNPIHGLVWSSYAIVESPFPYVDVTPTALAFLTLVPGTVLYYAGMGLLAANLLDSRSGRTGTAALFVGFLPQLVVPLAWFGGVVPGPLDGALVIGSSWSLALVAWAVSRHQVFEIVPLAREQVFESLDDVVIVVDTDGRVLDYNAAAGAEFPALAEEGGTRLDTALPEIYRADGDGADRPAGDGPAEDPQESAAIESVDGESPFVEDFVRFDGDDRRDYAVTATPLEGEGSVRGYAFLIQDVTERRRRVRNLERQATQLEQFASTLSHDLRNPLHVAEGYVEMARESEADGLEKVSDALDRMDQIIQDTLQLARQGQAIEDTERVELAAVAREAWETTETSGGRLAVTPEADVTVYADRSRLRTVFENLFRNAVEHGSASPQSPSTGRDVAEEESSTRETASRGGADGTASATPDGPTESGNGEQPLLRGGDATGVSVTVGRHDDGFYVADDGVGIPPRDRDRVFEYGYTTDDDGTGLGLAIVEAIAQAHGWSIEVTESEAGGARFVFSDVDVFVPEGELTVGTHS